MKIPPGYTYKEWQAHILRHALHDCRETHKALHVGGLIPASRAGTAMKLRQEMKWMEWKLKQLTS